MRGNKQALAPSPEGVGRGGDGVGEPIREEEGKKISGREKRKTWKKMEQ